MNKSFYVKFIISLLLLGALCYLLYAFPIISINIIGGFLLYLVSVQMVELFERKGLLEWEAYTVLFCISGILMITTILFAGPYISGQITNIFAQLPTLSQEFEHQLAPIQQSYPFIEEIVVKVQKTITESIESLLEESGAIVTSILTIPIIALVLVASRKTLKKTLIDAIPNDYFEVTVSTSQRIIAHIQDYVFAKFVETIGLVLVFVLGCWIIGMPHPILVGIIAGVFNIIPIVGIILTVLLFAFVSLLAGNVNLFLISLIVLLVGRLIDDFVLQAWILAKLVDVHSAIVVIMTLIGGELLGGIGLIIAIPVYVILKIIIKGIYDYLYAIERHELLLQQEKHQEQ